MILPLRRYYPGTALKDLVRYVIYQSYRFYNRFLENSLPLYDLQLIRIIKTLPTDMVCIDIGANEGQFLRYLNKQCKTGKILVFEPIPKLMKQLKYRYRNKKISFFQFALSDKSGETSFFYFKKRPAVSGLSPRNFSGASEINVPVIPLDQVFRGDRLDFIKIDVEGAEYNVLRGAVATLKRFKPLIIFESGIGGLEYFDHRPEEVYDLLAGMGYEISTMRNYIHKRATLGREEFINAFVKGYEYQFVAS